MPKQAEEKARTMRLIRKVAEATGWIGDTSGLVRHALSTYALLFTRRQRRPLWVVTAGSCLLCGLPGGSASATDEHGREIIRMCERCCAESCGAWLERKADEYRADQRRGEAAE